MKCIYITEAECVMDVIPQNTQVVLFGTGSLPEAIGYLVLKLSED